MFDNMIKKYKADIWQSIYLLPHMEGGLFI